MINFYRQRLKKATTPFHLCTLMVFSHCLSAEQNSEIEDVSNVETVSPVENREIEEELDNQEPVGAVLVVTASRHSKDDALINHFVSTADITTAPVSVTELLASQPGMSVNGQPGLFQTLSIRGLARHRVQAYVNGMRITSERRAGVAASFIDPTLLAGAEVTQGPASTYYGSGAIGGTIHLATRQQGNSWFHGGYKSDGNELVTAAGIGGDQYSAGIAYRTRNNGESIDGQAKNNHFTQHSLFYNRSFQLGDYHLDWGLIESGGDDIGKDNRRFPTSRITHYPEENHWLTQLTLSAQGDWQAKLYFHRQNLVTNDLRPEKRVNEVENKSLDIGLSFEDQWQINDFKGLYGVDYFARRGVKSYESQFNLKTLERTGYSALADGEENDIAVFVTANRDFANWSLHAGLRENYQSQKSRDSELVSDDYLTYFITAKKPLGQFNLSLSYGTGFRFASLSERLFSGTTGRGQTIGNPDLKPEESQAIDFGITYLAENFAVNFHRFNTKIDNFIERVSIDNDTRTYKNITSGELDGWQYQLNYFVSDALTLEFSGQSTQGEDQSGNPLSDIPAKAYQFNLNYDNGDWFSRIGYTRRLDKNSVGDGELALASANLAGLKVGYKLNRDWTVQFNIDNLLDKTYFNSADDLSTLATGRTFSVSIYR